MEDKYSLVILGLKPILQAGSDNNLNIRVRKSICQLCVALADHGYVRIEGSEQVILFLINNLIAQEDSVFFESFYQFLRTLVSVSESFILRVKSRHQVVLIETMSHRSN